ncbi:putative reverse transcriptase domain, reverse transcriptase zinc-binding domain protein [Tanacetum coccineum]|uniref:Reverse transcriptase domain, reverse transcriptase zinc-binding domain protein n=1 Tax=Tanacetum coccineum TaxID=301880 RepID=A0ABQ5CZF5_9ASTR
MHNYHLNRGPPRCACKIDIQKAYDTVCWKFLNEVLIGFGFHEKMIKWIMACVTSTSFSININGDLNEYFKGKRGLRQRDLISPYLFTLVKSSILNLMPFEEGILPIKYLGVPLISTRLLHKDCKILGKAKVAWEDVCLPKIEGGLVIWKLHTFNVALMSSHVWKILTNQETLAINTRGFNMQEKVVDIVHENAWVWPNLWYSHFPILSSIQVPNLFNNQEDGIYLKLQDGSLKNYYVREIWNDIRGHGTDVAWHSFVWSNYGIPRHVIHVWLVMRRRLKTQDRLRKWDVGNDVDLNLLRCPLCKLQPDSHEHLFFECSYSSNVWKKTNNVTCIVGRLIVAAMSYYVWQEQLTRVHGNETQKHGGFNKHYCRCDQIETSVNQFQEKDASGQYEEDMETVMARVIKAY